MCLKCGFKTIKILDGVQEQFLNKLTFLVLSDYMSPGSQNCTGSKHLIQSESNTLPKRSVLK